MATQDRAQLILQVDAQIAAAQRSLNQLARSVNQDAAAMEKSLDRVAQSHAKIGRALNDNGRIRSGFTQLSFQIGDVTQGLAMGTRASTIFAQQSGQVIQALQLMGGEGNKFLRFLGGPWGIAISTAAVILGTLIPKLLENKDAVGGLVDKMREQAEQAKHNREADRLWKESIEGVTEAIRKRREEQEKAHTSDIADERDSLAGAVGETLKRADQLVAKTKELEAAVQNMQALQGQLKAAASDPRAAGPLQAEFDKSVERVQQLRKEIKELASTASDAKKNIRGALADILKRDAEGAVDPVKKATDQIQAQIDQLTKKFEDGKIGPADYRKEVEKLTKALEDAKKKAKDTEKEIVAAFKSSVIGAEGTGPNKLGSSAAGYGQFMPKTFLGYFDRLFPDKASLSTSAKLEFRNVREVANAVIDKATDDYVAVLKKAGQSISAANLYAVHLLGAGDARKLLAANPNTPTSAFLSPAVLKGNPFLKGTAGSALAAIGKRIGDSSGAVSSGAVAIQRELDDQLRKQLAEQNNFEEKRDALNEQLLRAQGDLVRGIDDEADLSEKLVEIARNRANDALQNEVEEGKLTQAHADELKALNDSVAAQKVKAIEIGRQVNKLKQQDDRQQQTFQYEIDDLRFADEQAKTQSAHRKLQLEILDVVYQQKEAHLRALKAELELAGKIEEAADVQAQIDRLPTDKAHDTTRALQNTQDPLQTYFSNIPHTADEITQAFKSIEVEGIQGLVNALTHAGEGWDAMRNIAISALQDIAAQLIKLGIERMLFNIFGGSILGAAGGGLGALGGSAAVGIGSSAVAAGTTAIDPAVLGLIGLASGGYVSGPGTPTSDSIPAMLSNGEYVMSADAVKKFGVGYLDMMNSGRLPHKKGGGLLAGLFGVAGLLASGHKINPLAILSPGLYFGSKALKGDISPLALLSPGFALGKELFGKDGHPKIPQTQIPKLAANNNTQLGDTYNIHVVAPNTGDPLKDRQTGVQFAAGIQMGIAQYRSKGLIG